MDICTLIVVTAVIAQACWSENTCRRSVDGTKQICSGVQLTACGGIPYPTYQCIRPDGTSYQYIDRDFLEGLAILPQGARQ